MRRDQLQSRLQGSLYIFSFAALTYFLLNLLATRLIGGSWYAPINPVIFSDMFIFSIALTCAWGAFRMPIKIPGCKEVRIGFLLIVAMMMAVIPGHAMLLSDHVPAAPIPFAFVALLGSLGSVSIMNGYARAVRTATALKK